MFDPYIFTVAKADPTGKEPTPGAVLHITADLRRVRETLPHALWRAAILDIHATDARQVVAALAHLPQGTLDQVLVLLLQQRASLLRVRVAPSPALGEFIGREAAAMPQPTTENGYGAPYIEGWNAALSQPSEGECVAVPGWLLEPHAEHYVLRVVGEAMVEDGICDGDFLVVRRCSAAAEGEMVVAIIGDDATLRRFYLEGDTARLEAANPFLDPIRLPFADLKIQGVAVGLIRRFDRKEARP